MRFVTTLAMLFGTLFPFYASAHHLGPIVLGEERTEEVFYCIKNQHLDTFIAEEKNSIATNGSIEKFLTAVELIVFDDLCIRKKISYTPVKVIREWQGREMTESGAMRVVPFAAVKAIVTAQNGTAEENLTITVYSSDPPQKK